ncbi:uncharacterized protein MONOS_15133 [Monocercomonoides exilis]|uniref:uncharacterized protein n=1 Tax=Monocercomonoides exilis TaxID=2049356 RepID=UPI00355A12A2|nr:hypothetical protein MONOS_15133 [Monocercomonoides exilis]|eukprot:MONOS_15133.1-p1 / transcript=MONOS_15133.1 / gene=MONOS_15133 / organism=Monocercomonoides_exilis_PA203 / gene_product=unspecified product / transcript_product=unspecified product / location=Mono_scaffold01152:8317-8868(+) / protein_length=184 / sequence_SO=supercontig / SO=protein_coding / is_pseudo=false
MERMISTAFESTEHVELKTAHVLWMQITSLLNVQMKRLSRPQKIGLQLSQVWKLMRILWIFRNKIATDLCECSAVLVGVAVSRLWIGYFVCMWLGEKHAVQKKSEAARWAMISGVALFRKDFAEVWLFGKFVREEFTGDELSFFLFHKPSLFERGDVKGVYRGERELIDGIVLDVHEVHQRCA